MSSLIKKKRVILLATCTLRHQQVLKTRDSLCISPQFFSIDKLEHPLLKIHDHNPATSVQRLLQWRQGPMGWRVSKEGKTWRKNDDHTRSRRDWATACSIFKYEHGDWSGYVRSTLNFGLRTDSGCKICCFDSWDTLAGNGDLSLKKSGVMNIVKRTSYPSIAIVSSILWHNCMVSTNPPHIYSGWRYSTFHLESQIPGQQLSAEIFQS